MKRLSDSLLRLVAVLWLVLPISAQATPAESGSTPGATRAPLGLVNATGAVTLGSREIPDPLSTFAYFAGRRIATSSDRDARLTLTLNDGSVSLGPESAVVVTGETGRYRVLLEQGTLRVRFGASVDLQVATPGVRVSSQAGSSDERVEASFALDASGSLWVTSHRGRLEARGRSAAEHRVLEPGEAVRLARGGPVWLAAVSTPGAAGGEPPRLDEVSANGAGAAGAGKSYPFSSLPSWARNAVWIGGGAAAIGGVTGAAVAVAEDDDDPVTSPVVP